MSKKESILSKIKSIIHYRSHDIHIRTRSLRAIEDDKIRMNMARASLKELEAAKHSDIHHLVRLIQHNLSAVFNEEAEEILSMSIGEWRADEIHLDHGLFVRDEDFRAVMFGEYVVDTEEDSVTVKLPKEPVAGCTVTFYDYRGTFGINPLIVDARGMKILGQQEEYEIDVNHISRTFKYIDNIVGWIVY